MTPSTEQSAQEAARKWLKTDGGGGHLSDSLATLLEAWREKGREEEKAKVASLELELGEARGLLKKHHCDSHIDWVEQEKSGKMNCLICVFLSRPSSPRSKEIEAALELAEALWELNNEGKARAKATGSPVPIPVGSGFTKALVAYDLARTSRLGGEG